MEQGALLISKVGGIPLSSVPVKRNLRLEIVDILGGFVEMHRVRESG